MTNLDETVRSFLGESSLALDDQDYPQFLQHCDDGFHYQVKAYSDELGKEMVWLEHDRKGFESLLSMIPNHVRMQGRFSRQVVPSKWTSGSDGIEVTSHLSMFHTNEDGDTRLLLVGRYIDRLTPRENGAPLLTQRVVQLDTRNLAQGIHVPI